MSISVLDCTLRDGAYVVKDGFGIERIRGIIESLVSAKVDIIECGWLRDGELPKGSVFFNSPSDFCLRKNGAKYALMFDYGKYDIKQMPQNNGVIDIIRIAFNRINLNDIMQIAEQTADKGYDVFLQPSNTIEYNNDDIKRLCEIANQAKVKALYIVDTYGSMFPKDLDRITSLYTESVNPEIAIGFHSHNGIQLSFALSIQFAEKMTGNVIIDSSLCGIGRGAGNTKSELLLEYLKNYNTEAVWNCIRHDIAPLYKDYNWEYTPERAFKGLKGLHPDSCITL